MKKKCESCVKCTGIDRTRNVVFCREWIAPDGIAAEHTRELPIQADCPRWKPIPVEPKISIPGYVPPNRRGFAPLKFKRGKKK